MGAPIYRDGLQGKIRKSQSKIGDLGVPPSMETPNIIWHHRVPFINIPQPGAAGANTIDGGAEPPQVVFQAPTQHLLRVEPHEISYIYIYVYVYRQREINMYI